jgi:hypothetical protein
MIYAHHVSQHDAAEKLTRMLEERSPKSARTVTHSPRTGPRTIRTKIPLSREKSDAGGGTRTPDTRIMIPLL